MDLGGPIKIIVIGFYGHYFGMDGSKASEDVFEPTLECSVRYSRAWGPKP